MSNISKQNPTVTNPQVESDEEKFQRLMKESGFAPKPKKEELTVEQRVEKLGTLEDLLQKAKALKDEKSQKRIRRQMRNLGFKRSVWLKGLKAEFNQ